MKNDIINNLDSTNSSPKLKDTEFNVDNAKLYSKSVKELTNYVDEASDHIKNNLNKNIDETNKKLKDLSSNPKEFFDKLSSYNTLIDQFGKNLSIILNETNSTTEKSVASLGLLKSTLTEIANETNNLTMYMIGAVSGVVGSIISVSSKLEDALRSGYEEEKIAKAKELKLQYDSMADKIKVLGKSLELFSDNAEEGIKILAQLSEISYQAFVADPELMNRLMIAINNSSQRLQDIEQKVNELYSMRITLLSNLAELYSNDENYYTKKLEYEKQDINNTIELLNKNKALQNVGTTFTQFDGSNLTEWLKQNEGAFNSLLSTADSFNNLDYSQAEENLRNVEVELNSIPLSANNVSNLVKSTLTTLLQTPASDLTSEYIDNMLNSILSAYDVRIQELQAKYYNSALGLTSTEIDEYQALIAEREALIPLLQQWKEARNAYDIISSFKGLSSLSDELGNSLKEYRDLAISIAFDKIKEYDILQEINDENKNEVELLEQKRKLINDSIDAMYELFNVQKGDVKSLLEASEYNQDIVNYLKEQKEIENQIFNANLKRINNLEEIGLLSSDEANKKKLELIDTELKKYYSIYNVNSNNINQLLEVSSYHEYIIELLKEQKQIEDDINSAYNDRLSFLTGIRDVQINQLKSQWSNISWLEEVGAISAEEAMIQKIEIIKAMIERMGELGIGGNQMQNAISSIAELIKSYGGESFFASLSGNGVDASNILGSYAEGTGFVPETGIYQLHKGEAVVPSAYNQGFIDIISSLKSMIVNLYDFKRLNNTQVPIQSIADKSNIKPSININVNGINISASNGLEAGEQFIKFIKSPKVSLAIKDGLSNIS